MSQMFKYVPKPGEKVEAQKREDPTFYLSLGHPESEEIQKILDAVATGANQDVAGAIAQVKALVEKPVVTLGISTETWQGQVRAPYLGEDRKPALNPESCFVYYGGADIDPNTGKRTGLIARASRGGGTGMVASHPVFKFANEAYRASVGITTPSETPSQIPAGKPTAPAGDEEVVARRPAR